MPKDKTKNQTSPYHVHYKLSSIHHYLVASKERAALANSKMSMIPSSFSHHFNFEDPFSLMMYWQETSLVLSANVHGFNHNEVKVEIRDRTVFFIIREGQSCGHCIKSCQLPENVSVGNCKTTINGGVLTVTMAKVNKPKKVNPPVVSHSSGRPGRFFC